MKESHAPNNDTGEQDEVERPHRRFTLLDAMILIVAAAGGLALARAPLAYFEPSPPFAATSSGPQPQVSSQGTSGPISVLVRSTVTGSAIVYPSVMTFTFAILVLRLRQPRPRLRQLCREPGMVGGAMAIFSLLLALLDLTPATLQSLGRPVLSGWMINVWLQYSRMTGVAVAAAWLTLALSGCWRPGRDWIDRLGQAAAVCWIAALGLEAAAVWFGFF